MSKLNFSKISDIKDQRKLKANLKKRGKNFGDDFDQFVLSSICFFFEGGNKNIQIVNDLLEIAYAVKGINAARLVNYLREVIPHDIKKGKDTKEYAFTGKTADKEYDYEMVRVFLNVNPVWSQYGKEDTLEDFDVADVQGKIVSYLKSRAKFAGENGAHGLANMLTKSADDLAKHHFSVKAEKPEPAKGVTVTKTGVVPAVVEAVAKQA